MKNKKTIIFILFLGLGLIVSACKTEIPMNPFNSQASKEVENEQSDNNYETINVFAGPGTDYLQIGTIPKSKIKKAVKIENRWAEIEFGEKRGYVETDYIPELCTNSIPRVVYSIDQNVYSYPILLNCNIEITLFDDAKIYYAPNLTGSYEIIDADDTVTILCIEEKLLNKYAQIELNKDGIKRRCYANVIDLLSLDNPLLNFDSVKNTNALITYNGTEYYSSSGETTALSTGWHKEDEITVSQTEWDILAGIVNIIQSNDLNAEAIKSTEGKIQLYSFKDQQYINANTKNEVKSNFIDVADFLLGSTISFIQGAQNTLNLKIELDEYDGEHKIVIKAGSPIESLHAGETTWLSSLIVESNNTPLAVLESSKIENELIKSIYPNLDKNKTYSMELTFSKDFDDNYGYYIVIDNNINVYAVPIIHKGTSFSIYSEGQFICDATWELASSMLQIDEDSARKILALLTEKGFSIQGYTPSLDLYKIWEDYLHSTGETSAYFLQADYDSDGNEEAYAITGISDGDIGYEFAKIYFISSDGDISCVCDSTYGGYPLYGFLNPPTTSTNSTEDLLLSTNTSKFIVWEVSAYGSGSISIILGVKNGIPYEPDISNSYMMFRSTENGRFKAYSSDFSKGYHDYIEHMFIFDENMGEFILQ